MFAMKSSQAVMVAVLALTMAFGASEDSASAHSNPPDNASMHTSTVKLVNTVTTAYYYNVTISGVAQGVSFTRRGIIKLSAGLPNSGSANGANPVEVALISGDPSSGSETPGAINFATNTTLLGNQAGLDTSWVSTSTSNGGSTLNVLAQPTYLGRTLFINYFNARGGLLSNVYSIDSGYIYSSFSGNTVTATVNLHGQSFYGLGGAYYQATLTGSYIWTGAL